MCQGEQWMQAAVTKAVAHEVVEAALDVACQSNDDLRVKEYLACQPHIQAWAHSLLLSHIVWLVKKGIHCKAACPVATDSPIEGLHPPLFFVDKQDDRNLNIL